jgi:5-bromo-4-chloroindolyl phosphate hydrolysis protein
MSMVYNPEADTIARIEYLEMEVRELRRRLRHAHNQADIKVLNKQLNEAQDEIDYLRKKLTGMMH